MDALISPHRFSRRTILGGGALTVGFALARVRTDAVAQGAAMAPRLVNSQEVDSFLAVNGDDTVTVFCGKVDLGQGLRIAIRQIVAEELGISVDRINYVEGDTALTPDQGRTSGSTGIQRGGMQIRQAAATARKALLELAAQRLNAKADDFVATDGEIRPRSGGPGVRFSNLIGERRFDLKLDPNAPLKDPATTRWSAKRCRAQTCPRSAPAALPMCTTSDCRTWCMRASFDRRRLAPTSYPSMRARSGTLPAPEWCGSGIFSRLSPTMNGR